jgi:hypothetical protein
MVGERDRSEEGVQRREAMGNGAMLYALIYQNLNFSDRTDRSGRAATGAWTRWEDGPESPLVLTLAGGRREGGSPAQGMSGAGSCRKGCLSMCANSGRRDLIAHATSLRP